MMSCPPLPVGHPRVVETGPPGVITAKEGVPGVVFSTACWRGYIGTWEIKDGRLYLAGLIGRCEMIGDEPIFAEWVSGWLRIPRGEMLRYVHMGFESVYERELHLRLEGGVVVESKTVEAEGVFKRSLRPRSWWEKLKSFIGH